MCGRPRQGLPRPMRQLRLGLRRSGFKRVKQIGGGQPEPQISPLSACQTDLFDYRTPCRMRCRKRRNTMSPPFRVALAAMAVIVALGSHPASAQRGGRGGFAGGGFRGGFVGPRGGFGFVGPRGGAFIGPRGGVFFRPGFNRGFVGPRVFVGPGFVGAPWPWWGWAPPPLLHGGGRRPRRPGGAGGRAPGEAAEVAQGKIVSPISRGMSRQLALPFGDRPSITGPYLYTFDAVGYVRRRWSCRRIES